MTKMFNLNIAIILFSLTWIAVFGSAETLLATDTSRYPAVTISAEERMRLREGEVLTWLNRNEPGQKGWVQAAIRINASADQVWKVLTTCTNAEEIIPGLQNCRVVANASNSDTVEQRIKIAWYLPTFVYTLETRYQPYHRIEFNRVAGDFKELKGHWRFEADPDDGHTLVIYSVYMQPDFYVPRWIVRRTLAKHLPTMLSDLRRQVATPNSGLVR
jgi:ribosome-associated toxin RatA of RatAB toxin-antitoxin module